MQGRLQKSELPQFLEKLKSVINEQSWSEPHLIMANTSCVRSTKDLKSARSICLPRCLVFSEKNMQGGSGGCRIRLRGVPSIKNACEFLKPRAHLCWPRPLAIENGVLSSMLGSRESNRPEFVHKHL